MRNDSLGSDPTFSSPIPLITLRVSKLTNPTPIILHQLTCGCAAAHVLSCCRGASGSRRQRVACEPVIRPHVLRGANQADEDRLLRPCSPLCIMATSDWFMPNYAAQYNDAPAWVRSVLHRKVSESMRVRPNATSLLCDIDRATVHSYEFVAERAARRHTLHRTTVGVMELGNAAVRHYRKWTFVKSVQKQRPLESCSTSRRVVGQTRQNEKSVQERERGPQPESTTNAKREGLRYTMLPQANQVAALWQGWKHHPQELDRTEEGPRHAASQHQPLSAADEALYQEIAKLDARGVFSSKRK